MLVTVGVVVNEGTPEPFVANTAVFEVAKPAIVLVDDEYSI